MDIRRAPSGDIIASIKNGAVVQMAQASIALTSGAILTTDREIMSDMAGASANDFRPELVSTEEKNRFVIEGDIDVLFTDSWASQNLITAVQVSRDNGATWETMNEVTQTAPSTVDSGTDGSRVVRHLKLSCGITPLSIVTNYQDGDSLLARALIRASSSTGSELPSVTGAAYRLAIRELFWEA